MKIFKGRHIQFIKITCALKFNGDLVNEYFIFRRIAIREDMKDDEETSVEQAEGAEEIADVSENDSVDNSEENEKE